MLPRSFLPTLIFAVALPSAASAIEVHAHRGGSGAAPENSLPAFSAALALGVDALEMDLQLSRDGVLFVHHDAELDRSRCRHESMAALALESIRLLASEDLEAVRCNGESVPRFDEVLELVSAHPGPVGLTVELKLNGGDPERLRPKLAWRTLAALGGLLILRRPRRR